MSYSSKNKKKNAGFTSLIDNASAYVNTSLKNLQQERCSSCNSTLHLLKPKRLCSFCKENYCSGCISKEPFQKAYLYRCNRCCVFSKSEFDWDDLMHLRIQDLLWFLNRQDISAQGYKEKEQLVEIILDYYGNDNYHRRKVNRTHQVAQLVMNMQEFDQASPIASSSISNRAVSTPSLLNSITAESTYNNQGHSSNTATTSKNIPSAPSSFVQEDQSNRNHVMGDNDSIHPPVTNGTVSSSHNIPHASKRMYLEDIIDESDIDKLSVKQLKDLLALNCVDYKGCCERNELLRKAIQLFQSYRDNKIKFDMMEFASCEIGDNVMASSDIASGLLEVDLCKVCMNAVIDCVLLECGHMVTCLQCGKQMSECPICRQFVLRAVRVFK